MRVVNCGTCKARIQLNSELLASAAVNRKTEFCCPVCQSVQEIAYARDGLIHETIGRMIEFRASGAIEFQNPTTLEGR